MEDIILDAIPTMAPIIGGLMYLKNIEGKFNVGALQDAYGIDTQILLDIYNVRHGKGKLAEDTDGYIERLIDLLTEIGKAVNDIEVAPHESAR
jgi:hypothetical protein